MTTKAKPASNATLTIAQDSIAEALNTVCPVIESKSTIPVLLNVLIESIGENRLRFTGTDLDITMIREVEADHVPDGFAACLSGRKLRDIVVLLEGEMVEITPEENNWMRLTDGKARYRLPGVDKNNFAACAEAKGSPIEIPFDVLKRAIHLTGFTITKEQSRFTLSGAKFELADNKMRVITTDGHRLSLVEVDLVQSNKVDVLIPKKALDQILKLKAETIEFTVGPQHAKFKAGDTTIISRLLTGKFPNYELVLPKGNDRAVTLPVAELRATVKRISMMADDRNASVRLEFSDAGVTIEASSHEMGEGNETLFAAFTGEAIKFGFNWHYLAEILAAVDADKNITFSFKDPNAQTEFRIEGDDSFRHVVMPLRI